jgi:hypothetical protein
MMTYKTNHEGHKVFVNNSKMWCAAPGWTWTSEKPRWCTSSLLKSKMSSQKEWQLWAWCPSDTSAPTQTHVT